MSEHPTTTAAEFVLDLRAVTLRRDDSQVLRGIDWQVRRDERWVVLGANGCGKTSLVRIAALYDHPSSGSVRVLGELLGRTDVRTLRRRVAFVSAAFVDLIRKDLLAVDVVMCALNAALEPWWHTYTDDDRDAARAALAGLGIERLADHRFGTLSSGERQRVQLARALMTRPELLLLDEPTAGLDLAGRETFVTDLDHIGADGTPFVLVTHHLEEIPSTCTHALVMRAGEIVSSGPIETALSSATLSYAAGIEVVAHRHDDGRWSARRATPGRRG